MKWTFALLSLAAVAAHAQQFQNLDFEAANPVSAGLPTVVTAASAFPGWTVYLGSDQQSQVLQNFTYNTLPSVDILGPNWTGFPGVLDGSFSVYLQSGYQGTTIVNASIEQDGAVPVNGESLQFKAWQAFGQNLSVTFDGNNLALSVLSTGTAPSGQQYDIYGADISQYAGQTGLLEFSQGGGSSLLLDDISFSTASTPEPNPAILISLGGLAVTLFRKRLNRF